MVFVGAIIPNPASMGDANSASMRSLHSEEAAAQNLDLEVVAIQGGEQCSRCCDSEAYHMDEAKFNQYCADKFPGLPRSLTLLCYFGMTRGVRRMCVMYLGGVRRRFFDHRRFFLRSCSPRETR